MYGKGYWDKQIYMLQNIFTDLIYKYRCVILLINFICPGRFWMFCIYMLWNVLQLNDYTVHCNIFMTRLVPLMADENSLYHWGCITYEIRCSFFFFFFFLRSWSISSFFDRVSGQFLSIGKFKWYRLRLCLYSIFCVSIFVSFIIIIIVSDAQRGNVLVYFATCVFIAVRLWSTIVYICILPFLWRIR